MKVLIIYFNNQIMIQFLDNLKKNRYCDFNENHILITDMTAFWTYYIWTYILNILVQKNPKCTAGHFVEFFAENLYRGVIWPKKSIGDLSFSI